ncbi:helix-turn-helix transcriptional regulator [Lichenibacterium dinghuense]|jgi:DNA-binding CsgD family transcriptional regulator|uniref:helix-turn-helix transcriptional regulator n=1 Tax=Lichenibacterium dinghuense TaxID=2895977 RepID=UPI001F235C44|nr:helix-turn-helix transcriptional regulator [Lichenibacterium sp. 6Y81]
MNWHQLECAAQRVLAETMAGGSWVDALEDLMSAFGTFGGGIARIVPPDMFSLPTSGVTEVVRAVEAGRAPPITKRTQISPGPTDGFVCDQMDIYREARLRDPFYQDFLIPHGLAYQTSAFLDRTDAGAVNLITFKPRGSGGFDADELMTFSTVLPYMRAAAMASRGSLRAEARRCALSFERRGDPVIHLGHNGRVLETSPGAESALAPLIRIVACRIRAVSSADQQRLDGALKATLDARIPRLVSFATDDHAASFRLLVVPVLGRAQDVFNATAAVAIVIDASRGGRLDRETMELLAHSADLTPRESEVAHIVAEGGSPRDIAERIGISIETVRLHLKAAFRKLGVHSQRELALLAHRLTVH